MAQAQISPELDDLIDRGLAAVEAEALDQAESLLEKATHVGGESNVRVLHLAGLLAWANDDLERGVTSLMQAVNQSPQRPEIYLDCAECLFLRDEIDDAEAQARAALALPDIETEQADEARLLLAQIRLADEDPSEALEVLEAIDESHKDHPAFLSTCASVNMALERWDEAVVQLERATELEPDDPDLLFQLGVALEAAERIEDARSKMIDVLRLDRQTQLDGGETAAEPEFDEVQELRSRLEGVTEGLPDPVLQLIASAPITVQSAPTEEQVRDGMNPRAMIAFLGTPKGETGEADLTGIVILRDALIIQADDDDELERELFYGLMDEIQVFFRREDIVVAEG